MTSIIQPIALTSERLNLRGYQEHDEDILFQHYFGNHQVCKYLQRAPHHNIEQTKQSLILWAQQKWANSDAEFMWIIAERISQKPMGILIFMQQNAIGEIHFGLGTAFQRQGLMQEAIRTALVFLQQSKKLSKIETFSAVENIGSRQVLEKVGFENIAVLPAYALFPNWNDQLQDCVQYRFSISS